MTTQSYYNRIIIGKNYENVIFARPGYSSHNPTPYYFCSARNSRNCMPNWGKETKQRAKLVMEIRAFWAERWYSETVPEIKKALVETTPIPKDIVDFVLPEYFEYPYEIKSF